MANSPTVPRIFYGAGPYVCYLDFGACLTESLDVEAVAAKVAPRVSDYLSPLPVCVTTYHMPHYRPGDFTTVRVLPGPIGWRPGTVGTTPIVAVRNTSLFAPCVVYVRWNQDLEYLAAVISHEFVHSVSPDGVGHEGPTLPGGRPNLMAGQVYPIGGALSQERIARCRETIEALNRGERLCPYIDPRGQWTLGWVNLNTNKPVGRAGNPQVQVDPQRE